MFLGEWATLWVSKFEYVKILNNKSKLMFQSSLIVHLVTFLYLLLRTSSSGMCESEDVLSNAWQEEIKKKNLPRMSVFVV